MRNCSNAPCLYIPYVFPQNLSAPQILTTFETLPYVSDNSNKLPLEISPHGKGSSMLHVYVRAFTYMHTCTYGLRC